MKSKTYKIRIKGLDERTHEEMNELAEKILKWYKAHYWYKYDSAKTERYHDNRNEFSVKYYHGSEAAIRTVYINITHMEITKFYGTNDEHRSILNEDEIALFGRLGFSLEETYAKHFPIIDIDSWF